MKMSKRAEKALRKSIQKWEGVAAGTREDLGMTDCALCRLYHPTARPYPPRDTCSVCPVARATGEPHCRGTPYQSYWHAQAYDTTCPDDDGIDRGAQWWAEQELEFLRGLLPETGGRTET